jgi:hypothetical protein
VNINWDLGIRIFRCATKLSWPNLAITWIVREGMGVFLRVPLESAMVNTGEKP